MSYGHISSFVLILRVTEICCIKGKGCVSLWTEITILFVLRVDNPCKVCSVWTIFLWSKASVAKAKAVSKRSNLYHLRTVLHMLPSIPQNDAISITSRDEPPI